jgi:uncharacterized protein (DUF433 family)
MPMSQPCIVDRGDGPKIEGTRVTVYAILEYIRRGRSRDWIAAAMNLSSPQVQTAIDYIRKHEARVTADYERIAARISQGNPPSVEAQLQANRDKVKVRLALQTASHQ